MRRGLTSLGLSLLLCLVGFSLLNPNSVLAMTPKPGITIGPAIKEIALNAGQTSYSFQAIASNTTNRTISFSLTAVDFTPSNDTGGIAFLGGNVNSLKTDTHGLASWIELTPGQLTLGPNSSQPFTVSLDNINNLSAGGHYAAVLLNAINNSNSPNITHVGINQVLSMLVFTSTNGAGTQNLILDKPSVTTAWFHLPKVLNLFVSDTGNTQSTPRGYITLLSGSNKPITRTQINTGSALVLPGSTRLLETTINEPKDPLWPGLYKLQIAYNYNATNQLKYYNIKFFYIGKTLPVILLIIVLGLLLKNRLKNLVLVFRPKNRKS